jgi:hypothetical protein
MYIKLKRFCFALLAGLATTSYAFGDLKAIQKDKLPQDPALQSVYADIANSESMVREWGLEWRYKTPKKKVAALFKKDLALLQERATAMPDNEELQLLTGLAAHYSYNLDAPGSFEIAMGALGKAQTISPGDYRPAWFSASLKCQTTKVTEGMREFLAMERKSPWEHFSAGFWDDYLECATVTNMPSHAARAGEHLSKLHLEKQMFRDVLLDQARKRLQEADPSRTYESRQAWAAVNSGTDVTFTGEMFGLRFTIPGTWRVHVSDVSNGLGKIQISTGPYHGNEGDLWPTITIIARGPKPEESFDDFVKTFSNNLQTTAAWACPSEECLGMEGTKAGLYKAEGDGHLFIVTFTRAHPEFPGLLFEEPSAMPESKDKATYYAFSGEHVGRLPGRVYYLVALDSADSIFAQGKQDYLEFLKKLVVE